MNILLEKDYLRLFEMIKKDYFKVEKMELQYPHIDHEW